jgi:TRAP-type C4-dicarboxylate transport system permease small subunit
MSWAQEACIYMFVWMAKFGAAYGVRTGIHVGVDVLITRLPTPWHHKTVLFGLSAGAVFTGVIGTLGAMFVWENGLHYALFNTLGLDTSELTAGPTTPISVADLVHLLGNSVGFIPMCSASFRSRLSSRAAASPMSMKHTSKLKMRREAALLAAAGGLDERACNWLGAEPAQSSGLGAQHRRRTWRNRVVG